MRDLSVRDGDGIALPQALTAPVPAQIGYELLATDPVVTAEINYDEPYSLNNAASYTIEAANLVVPEIAEEIQPKAVAELTSQAQPAAPEEYRPTFEQPLLNLLFKPVFMQEVEPVEKPFGEQKYEFNPEIFNQEAEFEYDVSPTLPLIDVYEVPLENLNLLAEPGTITDSSMTVSTDTTIEFADIPNSSEKSVVNLDVQELSQASGTIPELFEPQTETYTVRESFSAEPINSDIWNSAFGYSNEVSPEQLSKTKSMIAPQEISKVEAVEAVESQLDSDFNSAGSVNHIDELVAIQEAPSVFERGLVKLGIRKNAKTKKLVIQPTIPVEELTTPTPEVSTDNIEQPDSQASAKERMDDYIREQAEFMLFEDIEETEDVNQSVGEVFERDDSITTRLEVVPAPPETRTLKDVDLKKAHPIVVAQVLGGNKSPKELFADYSAVLDLFNQISPHTKPWELGADGIFRSGEHLMTDEEEDELKSLLIESLAHNERFEFDTSLFGDDDSAAAA